MTMLPPATLPASARPARGRDAVSRLVRPLVAYLRARLHRREVADLLRLDDRMLRDIGLTRFDVHDALAGPVGVDPSVGLRLRSVEQPPAARDRQGRDRRLSRQMPAPRRSASRAAA